MEIRCVAFIKDELQNKLAADGSQDTRLAGVD